jgi:hypothetical protein
MGTLEIPRGEVAPEAADGTYVPQEHTLQLSENGGPFTCGIGGEALGSTNCTLEESLDVTTDNRNLWDEDILLQAGSGSPKQTKKIANEERNSFHPGENT